MRILVISLAGIGDTIFATPLIRELRANFPNATIDALVMWAGSRDLLEGNPHLNNVFQKNLIKAGNLASVRYLSQFRKHRYDVSFNTHPQSRIHYRFVARLINASVRISHGYDNASALDSLLVNRTLPQNYQIHSVENNLALLEFVGARPTRPKHEYEIHLAPAELAWAEDFIQSQKLSGRRLIGLHVGSGGTKNLALRRWPLDSYRELISGICHDHPDITVLLFGGPEEQKDHAHLLAHAPVGRVFHPRTENMRQAAALIQKCEIFLSVDTVFMHLAAAMKVPKQIVIETPTWNKPIQPYRDSFSLVKNPTVAGKNLEYYRYDGHGIHGTAEEIIRSMQSVSVASVRDAIERVL